MGLNVIGLDASAQFLEALKGEADPERKRKIIGNTFIDVFDEESKKIEGAKWLGHVLFIQMLLNQFQNGPSATIKSHHNVGGLPDYMKLKLVEPLKMLFKDEVRRVGASLEIDSELLGRHPFPGPD